MKHLLWPVKYGKLSGQKVATNEPSALIAIQATTQGQRPLTPYIDPSRFAQDGRLRAVYDAAGLPVVYVALRGQVSQNFEQKPGSIPTDQGLLPRCAPASTEQQQQSEAAYGANTCKS